MSTSKHIDVICVVVLVLALLLTVLFMNGEALGIRKIVDEDAEANSDSVHFTANDLDGGWDTSGATMITLNGSGAQVSGGGAYAYRGGVVIASSGCYVLAGTLTDGSITVDANKAAKVWLLLNGVDVTCADDACLRVDEADKVFLTLAEGTQNRFTSGADYSDDALDDGTDGVVYAHDDLTVNGSGSLEITANYRHGIEANDDLVITGGTISITAPQDAIHVNDSFRFCTADLTIAAGDDGIHSDTEIYIESGTICINECYEGIEAVTIDVAGGDITIYPTDDGLNANGGSDILMGGVFGGETAGEGDLPEMTQNALTTPSSGKDNKSGSVDEETYIRVSGGSITIINDSGQDADGLDSNGDIYITGGTIRVSLTNSGTNSAVDYGSENGGVAEISGGTIVACGSYAMAEAFDASSTQCSILYNFSAGAADGTTVALEDAEGNVLLSYTVPCSFSSVILSCPEMALGQRYLVVIGDDAEEITLEETSASFGDAASSMFGGTMNFGGMQDRGSFGGFGGNGDTDRPTPPDGRGEPDFGSMGDQPERPDGASFGGQMPGTGRTDDGPGFPGGAPDADSAQTDSAQTDGAAADAADSSTGGYDGGVWIWTGIAVLVLLAGLLFAFKFRKH